MKQEVYTFKSRLQLKWKAFNSADQLTQVPLYLKITMRSTELLMRVNLHRFLDFQLGAIAYQRQSDFRLERLETESSPLTVALGAVTSE